MSPERLNSLRYRAWRRGFREADLILVGVSRSGKTPTCLYMALHYGVSAANYPLTDEDLVEALVRAGGWVDYADQKYWIWAAWRQMR